MAKLKLKICSDGRIRDQYGRQFVYDEDALYTPKLKKRKKLGKRAIPLKLKEENDE